MNETKLYKLDRKNVVRIWSIQWDNNSYSTTHGTEFGEHIVNEYEVEFGLQNRTAEQQVLLVVGRLINRKIENGYSAESGNLSLIVKNQLGMEKQMKAVLLKDGELPDIGHDYMVFVQRKYNGHRCTIAKIDGHIIAYSSGGKHIKSIDHILTEIRINEGCKYDGELYVHGLSLQRISGMVRKQSVQSPDLKFIIFDQISTLPFYERSLDILEQTSENIILAETIKVKNFEEVKRLFFKFRAEGYEGAMLRHGDMGYEAGRRSKQIYKIKKLDGEGYYDSEFKVVGVVASVEGWARLVCKTETGKTFKVSSPGTHYEKRHVLRNIEKYVGRFVKIEYPELSDFGIPMQPVAIMWREKNE